MEKTYTVKDVVKITNLSESKIREIANRRRVKGTKGSYLYIKSRDFIV